MALESLRLIRGDALETLRGILKHVVVNTVVTSPRRRGDAETPDGHLTSLCDVFDAVNLHPQGSVWAVLDDARLAPDRLAAAMHARGWLVADKAVWVAQDSQGTLFRFAKVADAWVDADVPAEEKDVWQVGGGNCLLEGPIARTCPLKVCGTCGSPYERDVEMVGYDEGRKRTSRILEECVASDRVRTERRDYGRLHIPRRPVSRGWINTCDCDSTPRRGVVLDPFMGTAGTGEAALKLSRDFVGIDRDADRVIASRRRLESVVDRR